MGYDYGDNEESDYGYGDATPDYDYGYGDASPDYGYEDANADEDYGYGDAEPAIEKPAAPATTRPKRRCSVTKYNLENSNALTAADRIKELREEETPKVETSSSRTYRTDEKSSISSTDTPEASPPPTVVKAEAIVKKKGVMSRMRKRLSVFH